MSILDSLPTPFFVLAPMDDVTDTVFRQIIADCVPPDLFFTEFVNVDGLQSPGRTKLLRRILYTDKDRPLIVQIWGKNPENFYKTAREITDGTFTRELDLPDSITYAGIDINMGCPDKSVVKNGTCSALINNRELADEIIKATQEGAGGKLPVSVKTRLGFNDIDLTWHEFLLRHNLPMLAIHGRTRKEMSKVPAQWDAIGEIRKLRDKVAPNTKIVGNGDVMSRAQGLELAKQYGLDGIMIGRGVFQDPFIFADTSPWEHYTKKQRIELFQKHVQLFDKTWGRDERPIAPLNKFCKTYIQGFDGAKEFRDTLIHASSVSELLDMLEKAL